MLFLKLFTWRSNKIEALFEKEQMIFQIILVEWFWLIRPSSALKICQKSGYPYEGKFGHKQLQVQTFKPMNLENLYKNYHRILHTNYYKLKDVKFNLFCSFIAKCSNLKTEKCSNWKPWWYKCDFDDWSELRRMKNLFYSHTTQLVKTTVMPVDQLFNFLSSFID